MKVDLAAGFEPGSREEWRALALGVLRKSGYEGDDPEGRLSARTYDGVTIAPLLRRPARRARAWWARPGRGTSGSGTPILTPG